ncbi:MAG: hypothetical protein JXR48_02520 [Candidatus Delongbacteria bacterium]|nr:hypothetical protein [Candidatus Delongbacteria bacterium]MBN2833821.1 hypothetical protein [Candidatus Delongbacteria bacterium]
MKKITLTLILVLIKIMIASDFVIGNEPIPSKMVVVDSLEIVGNEHKLFVNDGKHNIEIYVKNDCIDGVTGENKKAIASYIRVLDQKIVAGSFYFIENIENKTPTTPHNHVQMDHSDTKPIKIDKVQGGFTIDELFSRAEDLDGKEIIVRGKVTRFSENIMSSNWLRIQDGTGDLELGTNEMVLKTDDIFVKNDIVTVRGILHSNFEVAPGMVYKIIVTDARAVK